MAPTARDLRSRVRIERRAVTSDGAGGTIGIWQTLIESRFAALTPLAIGRRAGEEVVAARMQGKAIFDCWLRYDSQTSMITTDDRVVDARDPTRVFNVHFIQDMDQRRQWLLLQLELGVAGG